MEEKYLHNQNRDDSTDDDNILYYVPYCKDGEHDFEIIKYADPDGYGIEYLCKKCGYDYVEEISEEEFYKNEDEENVDQDNDEDDVDDTDSNDEDQDNDDTDDTSNNDSTENTDKGGTNDKDN